ncbi:NUDIX domain-containing protein, partial [Streptomyces anulatus]|uniref:NUDIX domain-containing protein n=1 Tax=Streptomyces anulatus TaxID=1892 RepID=UPI00342E2969
MSADRSRDVTGGRSGAAPDQTAVQTPDRAAVQGAGQARRTPAVSCVFVCHDGHGRVLLAQRGAGARDEPGTWDCGAGALEYGESFE